MADQIVLIQTARVATDADLKWYDNRADIATVLSDVISYAENTAGVPNKANFIAALKVARKWVKKAGNKTLRNLVGRAITSADLMKNYFKPIQGKAVKAMCLKGQKTYNALKDIVYPNKAAAFKARSKDFTYVGIEDILDAVIVNAQNSSLPNKVQFIRAIKKAKAWVRKSGTPTLKRRVGKAVTSAALFNTHYKPIQIKTLIKKCGFTLASVPSIDKVTNRGKAKNPATVIQGKEAKIVIKGKNFPKEADIAISIMYGKNSDKTITVTKIKRVDATTIELTIKAAANAPTDKARTVEVFHAKYPKLLLAQKADAIKVSAPTCSQTLSVTPNALKKGETKEVTVTVDCGKLPANPALTVSPAGVTVSNVRRHSDTKLTFTASVPSNAAAGNRTIKVTGVAQGIIIISQGPVVKRPILERLMSLKKTSDVIKYYRMLHGPEAGYENLALRIALGLPSFPLQRSKMNPGMRAGLDTASPVLQTIVNLGSPHRPLPAHKTLKRLGDSAFFIYKFSVHGRMCVNPGYVDGGFGVSANPTFYLMSKHATVGIEPIVGYAFHGSRYQEPTRFRPNSFYNTVFAGGALSVIAGKNDWMHARLAVTNSNSWEETTDDKTYAFPFNSNRQQLSVRLDFNLLSHLATNSTSAPDVWFTGEISPYGHASVPITTTDGEIGEAYESTALSWTARVTAFWRNVKKVKPWVTLEGSQIRQGSNAVTSVGGYFGLDIPKAGLFRAGYHFTDNPEMHWGERSHTVDLRWQAPSSFPTWLRGLGANVFVDNTAGEYNGGVMLHYDFSRLYR